MPHATPPKLTEDEIKVLARQIVAELFRLLVEEENVQKAAKAWGGYLDRWIGGNFRKFVMYAFIALSGAVALKYQLWNFLSGK